MITKALNLSAALMVCISLMLFISCKGSIEGHLVVEDSEGESSETSADEWPGDTTTIIICTIDKNADSVCIEYLIEEPIEPPGDTIYFKFKDLPLGDYHLGFYSQNIGMGAIPDKELITYYHSNLDTLGVILNIDSSQTISITYFQRHINLGIVKIPY